MDNANLFVPVVHTSLEYPFMSLSLSRVLFRKHTPGTHVKKGEKGLGKINSILSSFGLVVIHKLPSPYETKCKTHFYDSNKNEMKLYSQNECLNDCAAKNTLEKTGKYPFAVIIKEHRVRTDKKEIGRLRLVSVTDLKNESMKEILSSIEVDCNKKCVASSCKLDYSLTTVSTATGPREKSMEFLVSSPIDPFLIMNRTPTISFNDYLLVMFSLLGFWLGASIHRMNPTQEITTLFERRYLMRTGPSKPQTNRLKSSCIRNRNIMQAKLHKEISQLLVFVSHDTHMS
jgi:hypothetical protein